MNQDIDDNGGNNFQYIGFFESFHDLCNVDTLVFSSKGNLLFEDIRHSKKDSIKEYLLLDNLLKEGSPFWSILKNERDSIKEERLFGKDSLIEIKGKLFHSLIDESLLVITISDITDYRKMEDIMKNSERRLRSFLDAIPDIFIMTDSEGIVQNFHNSKMERQDLYHLLMGKDLFEVMDIPITKESWNKILHTPYDGHSLQVLNAKWKLNQQITYWELRIVLGTGNIFYVFMRDNTELFLKEEQIRILEENSSFVEIASGMNTELTLKVQSIRSYAEHLQIDTIPDQVKPYIKKIEEASSEVEDILKNLLSFTNKEKLGNIEISLAEIVIEAVKFCRYGLSDFIEIFIEDINPDYSIIGSYKELVGVLINQIMNSREAISERGTIKISVNQVVLARKDKANISGNWKSGTFYEIIIEDNGCGIPQDVLSHMFDPLFSSKKKSNSTGMGLTILKGVVDQMEGGIQVESEINEFTRFHLYFPAESNRETSDESEKEEYEEYLPFSSNAVNSTLSFSPLDVEYAVSMLEGNYDLYKTICQDFILDYSGTSQILSQYLKDDKWEDAYILVHSIKGLAGLVGSTELQENARKYEESLKNHSLENLEDRARIFNANLKFIVENLEKYLELNNDQAIAAELFSNKEEKPELDNRAILELKKLEPHIRLAEYNESLVLLGQFLQYSWGAEWSTSVNHLEDLVQQFSFDDALTWVKNYI